MLYTKECVKPYATVSPFQNEHLNVCAARLVIILNELSTASLAAQDSFSMTLERKSWMQTLSFFHICMMVNFWIHKIFYLNKNTRIVCSTWFWSFFFCFWSFLPQIFRWQCKLNSHMKNNYDRNLKMTSGLTSVTHIATVVQALHSWCTIFATVWCAFVLCYPVQAVCTRNATYAISSV